MSTINFEAICALRPLPEYCHKRGIELRRNGASGELVGLCPLHKEKRASFTVYPDNHYHCFGCGAHGNVVILEQALGGGTRTQAATRLGAESLQNGTKLRTNPTTIVRAQKSEVQRPKLSHLRKATRAELQQIADSRGIDRQAVELAQDMGTLRVGEICGHLSWILLDSSGLCAEGRRLNREPYPAVRNAKIQLGERKAHTLRGSRKDWPVGILPAKEYRHRIETLLLVEGGPDYLAALHLALQHQKIGILPVAMLGRGQGLRGLHPESLEHFSGRRVRIVPHNDPDGGSYQAALVWCRQLEKLGCVVDFFTFKGLRKTNGEPVKDLNDCVELAVGQLDKLEELFA